MTWGFRVPRQVWVAVVGVGLLSALAWVATQSGPLAPIPVTVTPVVRADVAPALFGIGTVEARRAYVIGPTAAGRVRRVLVDVGDSVTAGQLLAEMEPVDLDARVTATAAAAERGRSAVAAADAQVRDAGSRHAWAATEARRTDALGAAGVVSQSAVDAARQAEQSAAAQLIAAEAAVAAARRDLARLEADIGGAQQQRSNLRLVAPVDGLVTARDVEPGSTVVAGQAVLRLEDPRSVWISVRLDQARSAGLGAGLTARITRRADPLTEVAGTVVRVEPISDAITEERIAKVAFDRPPDGVSSGEMAEVTLALPVVGDAVVVPNASLRHRGLQQGVWRYADGQLGFVPVTTGAEGLDGTVQILEGLQVGDLVVVYSERDLDDRSRVTVVPAIRGVAP
ncbi:MAG: efflux RND transporter periplasmic adaptor subunit [Vicinamibacterales bacterium]|nr:efflux RND transporter periplasmic adaptor subunit [Vicinamibacterales bacterium]